MDSTSENSELRERLARTEREAADRASQLERYAADLRETFKAERARRSELQQSYRATVRALANAVEARDAYTARHAERVTAFGLELAAASGLSPAETPELEFGFLLHDVGKVAVADAILFKGDSLNDEEYALMRNHTLIGWEILRDVDFLGDARLVVRHHHERWDGDGYPDGLAGEDIPLTARVFAVADALDALTSNRPYRPGVPFPEAREEIARGSGTQFDPRVVETYMSIEDHVFQTLREHTG